jgi:putative two-component system response regulator
LNAESQKTVLIIDDLMVTLMVLRSMLEGKYATCIAKSALDGLVVLKSTHVDLILLDIEMPGMSGMDFLSQLRTGPYRNIPVIFITSTTTLDAIGKAHELGAKGYLVKPVEARTLLDKIEEVLKTISGGK